MTYEEISTKYPIGKLLCRTIEKERRVDFWATETDMRVYRAKYPDAEFGVNGTVIYTETKIFEKRVEGWLVTEDGFFVAEDTWDGWQPLDEDELTGYEARGIASFPYEF